jgi:FixJ family two-component response regulator
MQKIPLFIVTSRSEDVAELRELLAGSPWEPASHKDAGAALKSAAIPILLLDRDTAENWQDEIKHLTRLRRGACVILLSNVSDQYLWDEVIQHGGFDCLARPFRKEQVLSTLLFAYAACRTPWPKLWPKRAS